jgi:flagellar protein FlaG
MAMTISNSSVSTAPPVAIEPQAAPQQSTAVPTPAVAKKPTPQQQPQPQPAQVQKAIEAFKQQIDSKTPNSLAFSVDSANGKTIVRITDSETGEMIRQIPSEEMVAIAQSLDKLQGMLLQGKA